MFRHAIEGLIDRLHDFDHENGGHVIDNHCRVGRLNTYVDFLLCPTKYGGHDWYESDTKKGLVKCFGCEFEAHPKYLESIGIIVDIEE